MRHVLFTAVTAAVMSVALPAGAATTARPAYGRADLQRDVNAIKDVGTIGVQARVTGRGGDLVATAGTAVLGTRRPVPANGYSRIASTTKTFVATVALQLVAEGRMSLDDTVEKLLPGVVQGNGNDGNAITLRMLLQHTSGLYDAYPGHASIEEILEHRYERFTEAEIVAKAVKHEPEFRPGAEWRYNNTGYLLISLIIEKATGRPWHKEVAARVSGPLGLSRTVWSGASNEVPKPHARGYLIMPPAKPVDLTSKFDGDAAGGLISTTADTGRFLRALLGGRLLPAEQLAQMKKTVRAPAHEAVWPGARYGLGLSSRPLSCGGVYWHHGGDDYGYKTRTGVSADGRRSVVVFMSTQIGDERSLKQEKASGDLIDRALCAS
ncbi:serine hydrolase domain-containing protein [Nonomuraea sp. NPDC059007]|uniref:serine hydrolase domain-containing protein n=1 Tax=Nonomuraea sp. NPDC059007 TaxID=3346692 RepID=UPI0036B70DB9